MIPPFSGQHLSQVWKPISVLVIGLTVLDLVTGAIAQAQTINAVAEAITVRIDGPTTSGSGVIVERNSNNTYTVLTNWHVVDRPGDYDVITSDGDDHYVHYGHIQRIGGFDLAVVFFTSAEDYRVASLGGDSSTLDLGQTLFAAGWLNPSRDWAQHRYSLLQGSLSSVATTPNDEGYALSFSASGAFVGVSGGPLLNQQGQVIGILGRGEDDRARNVSFTGQYLGLPIDLFLQSVHAEDLSIFSPPTFSLPPQGIGGGRPTIIRPSFAP